MNTTPRDPERVRGHRLTGRLHESCCGVVDHLAVAPTGGQVVVRHYGRPDKRRPADPGWAERVRRAAPVGTVAVLGGDTGHVVTEYVEGGSLADRAAAEPLSGTALQRLAIATATALAAAHRAGLAPAGIRPGRVLLGPDGPRLLLAVPETHDRIGEAHDTAPVRLDRTSAVAPERMHDDHAAPDGRGSWNDHPGPAGSWHDHAGLTGGASWNDHSSPTGSWSAHTGPAGRGSRSRGDDPSDGVDGVDGVDPYAAMDVYGWAVTVAYAAAGRDPFAAGSERERLSRMARGAASLAAIPPGGLRDLLADCLAAAPAVRPTAEQALLRLVEETGLTAPPRLTGSLGHPAPGGPERASSPGAPPPGDIAAGAPLPGEPSSGRPSAGDPSRDEFSAGDPSPGEPSPDEFSADEPADPSRGEPPQGELSPGEPARGGRAMVLIVAAVVAIALIAGGTSAAITVALAPTTPVAERTGASPGGNAASPSASWTPRSVRPAAEPPARGTEVALPGGLGTAFEHPADPVRLTSIRAGDSRRYARDPRTGRFADVGPHTVVAESSPDGRWTATFNSLYVATGDHLAVSFADQLTGERFSVPVLRPPYQSLTLAWSRQSDRVLLTAQRFARVGEEDKLFTAGYVIVDVAARTARYVPTGDGQDVEQAVRAAGGKLDPAQYYAEYRWTPDGRSVIARFLTAEWGQGTLIRDAASGRLTRMMHWVGQVQGLADWFSPAGDRFVTGGCATFQAVCVWKADDGSRVATVPLAKGAGIAGWYDDRHLIQVFPDGKDRRRVVVTDMSGKTVRVLAEIRAPADGVIDVRYTRG